MGRTCPSVRARCARIEKGEKMRAAGEAPKNKCRRCDEFIYSGHVCKKKKKKTEYAAGA